MSGTARWTATGAAIIAALAAGCGRPAPGAVDLLPRSQQIAVQEGWIAARHSRLLAQMRHHGVAMWIVVNEEFHPDPLAAVIVSPRPLAGNRDLFVFIDAGEDGLRKLALTRYFEENLGRFFESSPEPRKVEEALPALVREVDPPTIAMSVGGRRGPTRSLTHDAYRLFVELLGEDAETRFVSAADLIEEVLDTRLPEERPHFEALVRLTEELVRRALSVEVITPGVTTIGELRRWLFDRAGELGLECWFQPDLRVQRRGEAGATSRGFLAVAPEGTVILPGDLLHVDFGMVYMGLSSDWQRMAYVLAPGENDVPEGLKAALADTNALQAALAGIARPGLTGGEVYRRVMEEMERRGIEAQIYSHALGVHGHGVGPSIDFRAAERPEMQSDRPLRLGSFTAIELNTKHVLSEWDGQEVYIMEEDPAWLSADGFVFFRPRQTSLYLVPSR